MKRVPVFLFLLGLTLAGCSDSTSTENPDLDSGNSNNNSMDATATDDSGADAGADAGPDEMDASEAVDAQPDMPDACEGVDCSGNGTCSANDGGYLCQCEPGWTGPDCAECEPDLTCGELCCTGGTACRAGQCVTPTETVCSRQSPCGDGFYCDRALAANSADCTDEAHCGRCVPIAESCANGADCLQTCEVSPTITQTEPALKWEWGNRNVPTEFSSKVDVWSTPAVGRLQPNSNDGKPAASAIVFVSGSARGIDCWDTPDDGCRTGVLRAVDGETGTTLWSLDKAEPTSLGFAGTAVAIADLDQDGELEVAALTAEGKMAIVGPTGVVEQLSTEPVSALAEAPSPSNFGGSGAIAIGDMNGDGWPEIGYGRTVFTMLNGTISLAFSTDLSWGGFASWGSFAHFSNLALPNNGAQQYLTAESLWGIGSPDPINIWNRTTSLSANSVVADVNADGQPEVVMNEYGELTIYDSNGAQIWRRDLGTAWGTPPIIMDSDGNGIVEIGIMATSGLKFVEIDLTTASGGTERSRQTPTLPGSTFGAVIDLNLNGTGDYIVSDQCFVSLYDGKNLQRQWSRSRTSRSLLDGPVVADLDHDRSAEIVVPNDGGVELGLMTNCRAQPSWQPAPFNNLYRGLVVYHSADGAWSGARSIWNQSAYAASGVCDPEDDACDGLGYGEIPTAQRVDLPWAPFPRANQTPGSRNGFTADVWLEPRCGDIPNIEVQVRNLSPSPLPPIPAGTVVEIFTDQDDTTPIATVATTRDLVGGDFELIDWEIPLSLAEREFTARLVSTAAKSCAPEYLSQPGFVTCASMP